MLAKWQTWIQRFKWYATSQGLDVQPDAVKVGTLMASLGEEAARLFPTPVLTARNPGSYDAVVTAFERCCKGVSNVNFDRLPFVTHRQKPGECFIDYYTDLKRLAASCQLEPIAESILTTILIIGVLDQSLQKQLLRKSADTPIEDMYKIVSLSV